MSKMDSLKQAIDQIKQDRTWADIGIALDNYLSNGDIPGMKNFIHGVATVTYIKGCPNSVRKSLTHIYTLIM